MKYIQTAIALAISTTLLTACGGGGGGGGAAVPAAPSAVTTAGVITGFGSVFLNGIKFETGSTSVSLDDAAGAGVNGGLKIGMFVSLEGTINPDGTTGTATSIVFDDAVQGPISALAVNADGTSVTITVLGVTVTADVTSTIFDGTSFATLAVGDNIEVSGLPNASGAIAATRIEKKATFVPGISEVELKGLVSGTVGTTFTLAGFTIDFSGADLSRIPGGVIVNGQRVEAKGTLTGTTITATRVKIDNDLFGNDIAKVSLQGLVSNFVSLSDFSINGQPIDGSGAALTPASLVLTNGTEVEVDGPIVGGVLIATKIKARGGEVKLDATVQSVDSAAGTIILRYATGTVVISVDNRTRFRDDLDIAVPMTIADVRSGDFLEVRARPDGAGVIVASEIRRDTTDDDVIQGPVDSSVPGISITILGVPFTVGAGTTFENASDTAILSNTFFGLIPDGTLVKIKDDEVADGIADEAELED